MNHEVAMIAKKCWGEGISKATFARGYLWLTIESEGDRAARAMMLLGGGSR